MDAKGSPTLAAHERERRRRRQAEALRANLSKRKDQAARRGARADDDVAPPSRPDEGH